jgi:uncharacterized membrane protein YgcG
MWIIFGLGLAVTAMIWHLIRRAKTYERNITLSNRSTIVGSGNVVIQNATVKKTRIETKNSKTYTGGSNYRNRVSESTPTESITNSASTFNTSGTVIWPDDSPRVIYTPEPANDNHHLSFGGGSFGGGGSGGSYDDDRSSYSSSNDHSSHSSSDSGSSWGSDSSSSDSSSDSGSSWSSSD